MRFSVLSPIFLFASLGLTHNCTNLGSGLHSIDPAQSTSISLSPFSRTNSSSSEGAATSSSIEGVTTSSSVETRSSIDGGTTSSSTKSVTASSPTEVVATIEIQIGDLSGSGIINLSNVATASESHGSRSIHLTETSLNGDPHQTESIFASSTESSSPETTSTLFYVTPSIVNFNSTAGTTGFRPPLTPTATPTDSSLFTSSGAQTKGGLPGISTLLFAVAVQIGVIFLL